MPASLLRFVRSARSWVATLAFALVGLGCGMPLQHTRAQSGSDPLVIPKLDGSVELDGRPDKAAWEEARSLQPVQHRPDFKEPPTERTTFLIGYTEEYLYAACRCYDSGPLSVPSFKRDYFRDDTDGFALLLDTFNDNENGVNFLTTPSGLRSDWAIFNDASGALPFDVSWNAFWDAEAVQTEAGWFAEMRIPISSLRFDAKDGEVVMGLAIQRLISRNREWMIYPSIPPNWGRWSLSKPSQFRDVVFKDLEPEPPLRVTPYALGGLGQQSTLNEGKTAYDRQTDPTVDAGLDIKYGISSNFTLDLTVNTDFAQVEADNQQINLTRFPLFFPEKRRFFLERASTFSFGFGRPNRLFYSRRIGLFRGRQVRILAGGRVVGRSGPWDVGVLNMQTAREPDLRPGGGDLPSENFGVVRVQRELFNEDSNVGGIFVSRLGRQGGHNVAYDLDGIFRIAGQQYVTAKWAQTFRDGVEDRALSLDPARVYVLWERRSYEGLNYNLRYDRAGRLYEPGVGLELRDNYARIGDRIGYGWIPGEDSPLQRHRLNIEGDTFLRNGDGSLQSLDVGPSWGMLTNSDHSVSVEASHRVEDLRAAFPLSASARVPPGRYGWYRAGISYEMPTGWSLRAGLDIEGGGFYDGRRGTVQVSPTWNASRYLNLSGFYQLNRITFPDRRQDFAAHGGRVRIQVTPNVEYSISTFVQYNSAGGWSSETYGFGTIPGRGMISISSTTSA